MQTAAPVQTAAPLQTSQPGECYLAMGDLIAVVLYLLSNPSCRRGVGASLTDVAVTVVAGIGDPAAEGAGLVALPLPVGKLARVAAQLGCDRGCTSRFP